MKGIYKRPFASVLHLVFLKLRVVSTVPSSPKDGQQVAKTSLSTLPFTVILPIQESSSPDTMHLSAASILAYSAVASGHCIFQVCPPCPPCPIPSSPAPPPSSRRKNTPTNTRPEPPRRRHRPRLPNRPPRPRPEQPRPRRDLGGPNLQRRRPKVRVHHHRPRRLDRRLLVATHDRRANGPRRPRQPHRRLPQGPHNRLARPRRRRRHHRAQDRKSVV